MKLSERMRQWTELPQKELLSAVSEVEQLERDRDRLQKLQDWHEVDIHVLNDSGETRIALDDKFGGPLDEGWYTGKTLREAIDELPEREAGTGTENK